MSDRSQIAGPKAARVRPAAIVAATVIVVLLASFLVMAWVRSEQGHGTESYPSKIEALASNRRQRDPRAESSARGRVVFEHYCSICHGANGQGDGFNSTILDEAMKVAPRDFTSPEFWRQATDERIYFAISRGGPSVGKSIAMPAWENTIGANEIRDLVAYLKTIGESATREQPE